MNRKNKQQEQRDIIRQDNLPVRTHLSRLTEFFLNWITNTDRGGRFGHWISKKIALPQLKHLVGEDIPWTPFRKPLSETTVVLITTGGVHLRTDRPFKMNSDSSFRVIPKDVQPNDLAISHRAYDRTDALRDINLVFPIERAGARSGTCNRPFDRKSLWIRFNGKRQASPAVIKEVAKRISESGVDLALLVPA